MKVTLTGTDCSYQKWIILVYRSKIRNFPVNRVFLVTSWKSWLSRMLLVVGAQMSDRRLAALIGMLRPKSRIALSPAEVWRAMQVCNKINNLWKTSVKWSTNHLQLSSVIGSNNITISFPFLALHLNGVRQLLVQCLFIVMNMMHFWSCTHRCCPHSSRLSENLPKIKIWLLAKMWLHLCVLVP